MQLAVVVKDFQVQEVSAPAVQAKIFPAPKCYEFGSGIGFYFRPDFIDEVIGCEQFTADHRVPVQDCVIPAVP